MIRAPLTTLFATLLAGASLSCEPRATDEELERMCAHLAELREGSKKIEIDVDQCVADAREEGVSRKQALCRISAVNPLEYWVRCRTGEAR